MDDILEICKFLDKNNWHAVYLSDHFMHHKNHVKNGNMIECWTGLSAIASATKNIKISSFVSPLSFRHPGILANMATTVDEISKGRLILGIGAGWQENEHLSYGFNLLDPKDRIDRFKEGAECIIGLLNNPEFSFDGKYYKFDNATCEPKKYNHDIPIMIGCWSGNPRMLSIGKKYGDIINLIGSPEFLIKKLNSNIKNDTDLYKNVAYNIFLLDNFTQPILKKNLEGKNGLIKPLPVGGIDFISKSKLINYINLYKSMNFDEILISDISFINNDDLFLILNYIKNSIEEIN